VIWIGNFGRRCGWKIRDKFQGTFHIKVLRVHGNKANGAPNSELGKGKHQSEDIGLGPNREGTKGNWTDKMHRTGNYIKCVQCAELLKQTQRDKIISN
jgi:hypothetical protein